MPEGHTIHRAARDLSRMLVGSIIDVTSPQGRFASGAAVLDGRECYVAEAYGKHLLLHFDGEIFLHIHLGLFGRIRKHKIPAKDPRGAVRVRLVSATHVVDINGPTICEIIERESMEKLICRIGPDLIRDDADPDRAYERISKSRVTIGKLLMDQSEIAGIGNIYRTEILWRQSIHPDTAGRAITRRQFESLWTDAKELLTIGVKRNAIITVDDPPARPRVGERLNIFNKAECPTCAGPIARLKISGRRAFVCVNCQPLVPNKKLRV